MRLVTKAFLTLAGGLLLTTIPGRADDFIINDLTDAVSVTHFGTSRALDLCGPGGPPPINFEVSCMFLISPEVPGTTIVSPAGPHAGTVTQMLLLEPGSLNIGDAVQFDGRFVGEYQIFWESDAPEGSPVPNPGFAGGVITENGTPQLVATLGWSDGTTDSIFFQSDVDVPEPASLLLLGTGLLGLAGAARRKWVS